MRADGWREAEIEEVEAVVRRLLTAIVAPEANEQPAPPRTNATE